MPRSRVFFVLDVVIAVLVVGGIAVWLSGGFQSHPFGIRVSLRRPDRTFFLAALLAFVRWRAGLGREIGFLRQPVDLYRRWWAAAFQRQADEGADRPRAARWWPVLFVVLGLVGALAVQLREQLQHMQSVPDIGDPLFSIWRMGWVHAQWAGDPRPLFDANIFHPKALTLTLSDSMLLPSLAASPLLSAGVAPTVAYNVLLLSAFLLSGLAASLLAWRLTRSMPAAFVGGLLYALYPYRYEHYSHLELQMTLWMPLALWFLHRLATSWRMRDAAGAGLSVAAQLYSSMYYGVFFMCYAAAVMGVLLAVLKPGWRRAAWPIAAAGVLVVALAVPLARPYLAAQAMKGERQPWVVDVYSATPSDYLRPHFRLATWAGRLLPDDFPERALFPGVTPLVLAAAALVPPLGPIRLAYTAGAVLAFDLSRGMKGALYPYLYDWLPPIRGMRSPARFSIVLAISLVVLSACGVRRLLARVHRPQARAVVLAAIVAAAMVDLRPALGLAPLWPSPPAVYQQIAGRSDVVLAEFPFEATVPVTNELPFMYFSVWHWQPMVNGYSGFLPADHEKLIEDVREFPDGRALEALRSRGVTHVTANCALMPDRCATFLARADASPALSLLMADTWQGQPVRLYELKR